MSSPMCESIVLCSIYVHDVVVKKVHVRYLISWWVSCICINCCRLWTARQLSVACDCNKRRARSHRQEAINGTLYRPYAWLSAGVSKIWNLGSTPRPTVHSPTCRNSPVPRIALTKLSFLQVDEVMLVSVIHNPDRWTEVYKSVFLILSAVWNSDRNNN